VTAKGGPPDTPRLLTTSEHRVEGRLKVTGEAAFAGDVSRPGMLWAAFRRSDVPHARIVSIDISRALNVSGVHAVLTARDIGSPRFGRRLLDQPVLAGDKVRFVGERIAAVAADTREAAEEAAQWIRVEYEELPAVFDADEALAPGAPILHEDWRDYVFLGGERQAVPHANIQGHRVARKGEAELESIFARAWRTYEHAFTTPRQHHGYVEPHAALSWIDESGLIHVVSTNKTPFLLRGEMAAVTDAPEELIDIDSGYIGGDFGGKGYSPDEYICYYLARATGRPVKAVMSYTDELTAASTRHSGRIVLRTAVDEGGRFLAHEGRAVFNGGAYAAAKPLPGLIINGGLDALACYRIPNVSIEVLTVYTNTVPAGHMRAPGQVQALFAGESHVDMIARDLGMDPIDLRLVNILKDGEVGPVGEVHLEVQATAVLDAVKREARWAEPKAVNRGRGVAIGRRRIGRGRIELRLTLEATGRVIVVTGMTDQGAGGHTLVQRVVAAELGIPPQMVEIRRESTAHAPFDPGAGASRLAHLASQAAVRGAEALKERIEAAATEQLGDRARPAKLSDGQLFIDGSKRGIPLEEAAARLLGPAGELVALGAFEAAPHGVEPEHHQFCACVVDVTVDPETGEVKLLNATLAADVGAIFNPIGHQGQIEGGFAFGVGAAMMEELPIEDGRVTSLNLGDYKLPTSVDLPPLKVALLRSREGPGAYGAKMAGELSNSVVAPAIANAIADAVDARILALPITPERVLAALEAGGPRSW